MFNPFHCNNYPAFFKMAFPKLHKKHWKPFVSLSITQPC